MAKRDPRVTAYIKKAAPFARPILTHIREVVLSCSPAIEETIKWGMPTYTYRGILCHMAAFKQHAALGFWRGALVVEAPAEQRASAMGEFGRVTDLAQLPSRRVLAGYVRSAMRLNDTGAKPVKKAAKPKPAPRTPTDLGEALARNAKARAAWTGLSPSHRREYVEWIAEAKRPETRVHRVATTVAWVATGKSRNWKYETRPS